MTMQYLVGQNFIDSERGGKFSLRVSESRDEFPDIPGEEDKYPGATKRTRQLSAARKFSRELKATKRISRWLNAAI